MGHGKKRVMADKAKINTINCVFNVCRYVCKCQADLNAGASIEMQIVISVEFFSADILNVFRHLYLVILASNNYWMMNRH